MAEGDIELDPFGGAGEEDPLLPVEDTSLEWIYEQDTSFNGTDVEKPSWAVAEEEPKIEPNNLANDDELASRLKQFDEERVKYSRQENLEFKGSKDGALWVRWGDKWVHLTYERYPEKFLSESTIEKAGGVQLARALGMMPELSPRDTAALQQMQGRIPTDSQLENIPLRDLSSAANGVEVAVQELSAKIPMRDIIGLNQAIQRTRGDLTNNLAKLSELDDHIALEKEKLGAEDLDEDSRSRIEERLSKLQDLRASRLEAAAANREALRSQISRIRETIRRILHEDTTLAERIRTLFREQGVTIASILTAIGMAISTLVLALTGGGGGAPPPNPPPSDKGGLKEWVKKHLESLGRALAKLAGKAAAALPGIIGSIVSWLLGALGKVTSWAANNLWAVVVAVGGLLFIAAREWVTSSK